MQEEKMISDLKFDLQLTILVFLSKSLDGAAAEFEVEYYICANSSERQMDLARILAVYLCFYRLVFTRVQLISLSRFLEQILQQEAKMMAYLNVDILKTILVFLAMTSDGATDVTRAMMTCTLFVTLAKDRDVLKAINWSKVKVAEGREHLFYHINGLLSQSAELGNETAQYVLSKAMLLGSKPLWSRMLDNDEVQAYVNNFPEDTPESKQELIDILQEEAIIENPCISNVFYGNRHHTRLVRVFISQCSSEDIAQMGHYLDSYAQFFKGFETVFRSGFFYSLTKMSAHGRKLLNEQDPLRYITEEVMDENGSTLPNSISIWAFLAPEEVFEKRREQVIRDFNILFPPSPAGDSVSGSRI